MATNYAAATPLDRNNNPIFDAPAAKVALQTSAGAPAASSLITLDSNATTIEITTVAAPVVIKWFAAGAGNPSVTTSNFDNAIPKDWTRRFVVPISGLGVSSVVGLNAQAGLFPTLAVNSFGAAASASILTTVY